MAIDNLYGTVMQPSYAGMFTFMRRKYTHDLKGVDVAVTGIPFDLAVTARPGARYGPSAIRHASAQLAWGQIWPWNFDPFERLAVVDYGDCEVDKRSEETIISSIEHHITGILDNGASLLTLGGDHFISYPILQAYAKKYGPLALVQFDAHTDSSPDKEGKIDHGTMFYQAVREGIIDTKHSIQVGIRTAHKNILGNTILDILWLNAHTAEETAMKIVDVVSTAKAYLTFDVDCLDPSYAPGTGTPVIGGLSSLFVLQILRNITLVDFLGMDIVEVAPIYDQSEITGLLAATIATEYLCVLASKKHLSNKDIR